MTTENLLESEDLLDGSGREDRAATIYKKFRVQLDFEPADMTMINRLVDELGLGTRAELFRSSLRALRWMVEKKKQGCVVLAVTPDERYIQPEFDFLDGVEDGLGSAGSSTASAKSASALTTKSKSEAETAKAPAHA